jgi:hypothetical protein
MLTHVCVWCSLVSLVSVDGGVVSMVCVFFLHYGGPVNFHMASANVLEFAKFQAGLLHSCTVERINPIRGAVYGIKWWVSSRNEETLFSVYCTKFLHTISLILFRSNVMRCIQPKPLCHTLR